MAFGQISFGKKIAINFPKKFSKLVEPFGDNGSLAFEPGKKKPKEHIVNYEDEKLFTIISFLQNLSGSDKSKLKSYDWVASIETFETVLSISATEGTDFFYRFFYLKNFGIKQKDPELDPLYDWLKNGDSAKKILFSLSQWKGGLKGVTILNEDPISVLSKYSGGDSFLILIPKKPEHVDSVFSKITGFGGNFFFARKSKSNEDLFESVKQFDKFDVSYLSDASIMVATIETITNYKNRFERLELAEGQE